MGPEMSVVVGSVLMVIISAVQNSVISNDGAELCIVGFSHQIIKNSVY